MFLQFPEPALGRTCSTRKDSVRVTESFGIGIRQLHHRGQGHRAGGVRRGLLEKAQGYANQAIKFNPGNAAAHFELSRADGRLAQFMGILQSLNLAADIRWALAKATEFDPSMDEAYVALGLWNAELISKGFIVTQATGADRDQVVPNFQKAIALAPNTIGHRVEYANALLNRNANRPIAVAQLQKAMSLTPVTFWGRQDQATARKTLDALK